MPSAPTGLDRIDPIERPPRDGLDHDRPDDVDQIGPDLLCFASDYPHPEGTSDPIAKFEASMTNCDQATMDAFYHGNMADVMGISI